MKILHFVRDVPSADDVVQANRARVAGDEYKFVSEAWALENDKLDGDKIVTDNDDLVKKYKGMAQYAPKPESKPEESGDINLPVDVPAE